MDLLEECMVALGERCTKLSATESKHCVKKMCNEYPIAFYGRIDWDRVNNKKKLQNINAIDDFLKRKDINFNTLIYIIWDNAIFPVISCQLATVLKNIDYVTSVSFDTWLYCPTDGWVLELDHDDNITFGFTTEAGT